MTAEPISLASLNDRSRTIFRQLVETYLDTGDPVGSRTLSRTLPDAPSAATIRNTMQDLELLGLLDSPHVSAGRIPTEIGLRLFVDGLLEIGDVSTEERAQIENALGGPEPDMAEVLQQAGAMLSGLTSAASLVSAPKQESPIKHIEFVALSPEATLVVLVTNAGDVENRIIRPPAGLTPSAMREASNFLNAALQGRTLSEAQSILTGQISAMRAELDTLTADLVEKGVAVWRGEERAAPERLIVRGRANLLADAQDGESLDQMRALLDDMERKQDLLNLLDLAETGDGVRVFIGSENKLFSLSGSSLVISPYMDAERRIIGAIGVIGPTRLNYGRVVPIVDYTARLIGRMVADKSRL